MGKIKLDKDEIVRLYQSGSGITFLCKEFRIGKLKVKAILKEAGVEIRSKGGVVKHNKTDDIIKSNRVYKEIPKGESHVLVCKKTNKEFTDINNKSGGLTTHLKKVYDDITIPTNHYLRKKYYLENNEQWYEKYFTLTIKGKEILETRRCKLCDWTTVDVDNKSGMFVTHLKNNHNKDIYEYLEEFPEDKIYHKNLKPKLVDKDDYVVCEICKKRLKTINDKHLKTHNITSFEYKLKYGNKIISNNTKNVLSASYYKNLALHENTYSSKASIDIFNHLKDLGISVRLNDKKLLGGTEIDILINDIKIGIEYNGNYYHTEKMGKDKNYHLNKTKLMNEKGYRLIHIFEDEWIYKKKLIIKKIEHLIGKSSNTTIGARKCIIKEISKDEKKIFLENNHIQGNDISYFYLGAFYEDKLISVMTFNNKRNMIVNENDKHIFELTRFATDNNYKVPGIGSRLLKYFIINYNPSKIISFADRRWTLDSDNNLYINLGFKLVSTLKPDYKYFNPSFDRNKRLHKFGFGKSNLKKKYPDLDFSKTEKELTSELGFDRIWDCGLFKYELII